MTRRRIRCGFAESREEREQVYRLRYECYHREGFVDPAADRQFSDRFDVQLNSFSFLARGAAEEPLASVRISVVKPDLGWTDSPVRHIFGDNPLFHSGSPLTFVEASRLCFARQVRRDSFVQLLGNVAALAEFFRAEWLVACPRIEHARTYERLFGFQRLSAPRRCFGVSFETVLLGVRMTDLADHVRNSQPMLDAWSGALAAMKEIGLNLDA